MPRQGSHMVEPDTMSVVELYHVVITNKIIHSYRIDRTAREYRITSRNGEKRRVKHDAQRATARYGLH